MKAWLLGLLVTLTACREQTAPTAAPAAPASTSLLAPSPERALDALDARTPLPLLPMMAQHQKQSMRDHLLAVQQIVAALAGRDFAAMESAALRLGYSESMGAMCQHLGSGAPGFAEAAIAFHRAADDIGRAARARDAEGALAALGSTLEHCTSCHAAYKQQLVDEATFARLGAPHPSP